MFIRMTDFIIQDALNRALSNAEKKVERIKKICWGTYKAPYLLGTRDMREANHKDRFYMYFHFFEIICPNEVVSVIGPSRYRRSLLAS